METLADIRLFVEAATVGGLAAAGRRLELSPATASTRLAKLEATLQVRLFDRTTRRLRLTEEGSLYLAHCREMLSSLEAAHAALQAGRGSVRGDLRVSATVDFGQNVLRQWLDEFNRKHPDVRQRLLLSDTLASVSRDDVDVAIRFGAPPDGALVARRLAENQRVLCAAPRYLASQGEPAHPRELALHRCISQTASAHAAGSWTLRSGRETFTSELVRANARHTDSGAVARLWALDGHGIVLKAEWDVRDDLRRGRLRRVLPAWRGPDATIHALYRSNRYALPRVRAFLDFLVQRFAAAAPGT